MSLRNIIDNSSRVPLLKNKLRSQGFVRVIEVHSGISGLIANDLVVEKEGKNFEFDAFWESSLTDSALKGYPDIEVVTVDSRLETIRQIMEVTSKPIIVDGDTGGDPNQFEYMVKRLERTGVSMVIIEDKVFPKRNSLESGTNQELERIEVFCEKIRRGRNVKISPDFMVVARIESLIAGLGLRDALERAEAYLKAGADGLMIHTKAKEPDEILEFARKFREFDPALIEDKVLVCVPTTYNSITTPELVSAGFGVVIYANQMFRAAVRAMEETAREILENDRSFEVDPKIASVKEIFARVGFLDVKEKDKEAASRLKSKIRVVIPAAGVDELTLQYGVPKSLLDINGKKVIHWQLEKFMRLGINNIVLIRGYNGHLFDVENIKYYDNPNYQKTHILDSLFTAREDLEGPFIYLNADILFNDSILSQLIECENREDCDFVLVVDNSYVDTRHVAIKRLDLVQTDRDGMDQPVREVSFMPDDKVRYVGKMLNKESAIYEFIGLAYFSRKGADVLKGVYDSLRGFSGKFHEADAIERASFTDIMQELVDRGYPVRILRTHKGWMEIHTEDDLSLARSMFV